MAEPNKNLMERLKFPCLLFVVFWTIAIVFWQLKGNAFFLFNFGYIGTAIAVGISAYEILPRKKKPAGRRFAQLLVGIYMLGFLGLIEFENMQLEGFFFYILGGFFSGSVIHYFIAKIFLPVLFGRGWCGWACWTAMVLDYLPYKRNSPGRLAPAWENIRYLHFGLSLSLVLALWFFLSYRPEKMSTTELVWLIIGNVLYFASGIILAIVLKDNRAFCKYLCPITVLLKIGSRFALFKMQGEAKKCRMCQACARACPMDINIPEYIQAGKRVLSTECILCQTCSTVCPENNISLTSKWDIGGEEIIRRR